MKLGVNIDHIAVLRNARKINDPDPLDALGIVKRAGADQITIHLREDRRHIHDDDARKIIQQSALPVNLECSLDPDIIDIVCELRPHRATLVPEKREEVTTEGGLDVLGHFDKLRLAINKLHEHEIEVSLFIDPEVQTIEACAKLNVAWIELHTGSFANIFAMLNSNLSYSQHSVKSLEDLSRAELNKALTSSISQLQKGATKAQKFKLKVAAGHGLNYQNLDPILGIHEIDELNIGQSIIARSVFTGLENAVLEMKALLKK
jgi:pyridoxine 5-phosphate synthase